MRSIYFEGAVIPLMDALYQEKILSWARLGRAITPLSGAFISATISNPICGDRVEVRLCLDADKVITNVSADVRGCALCEAGAGLFTSLAPGMTATALPALESGFSAWLGTDDNAQIEPDMQDFTPVRRIRNRQKCVLLAFKAGTAALSDPATGN